LPSEGSRSPAIAFRRVDLPHPEGPMKETKDPGLMSMETFLSASMSVPGKV
jgi:hypothetical protein